MVLRTASVGKVLLLLECARLIDAGELQPGELLTRTSHDLVADSGLWHVMRVDTLPLGDVATLVAAVSDNLATNVLLRRVGRDRVDAMRVALDLEHSRLVDRVRSCRDASTPWTLSTGTASELSGLACRIGTGTAVGPAVDAQVARWLGLNTDLSMVAGAFVEGFGVDPLAHGPEDASGAPGSGSATNSSARADEFEPDPGSTPDLPSRADEYGAGARARAGPGRGAGAEHVATWNKTGTDDGVRADVGWVELGTQAYAYAVIAAWDPVVDHGGEAVRRMREVGTWIAQRLGDA